MKDSLNAANVLITYFIKKYNDKFDEKPIVNRAKMKFAVAEILQDWSQQEVKEFMDYYIKSDIDANLPDFCRRYDEIIRDKKVEEADDKDRRALADETRKTVLEFRKRYL